MRASAAPLAELNAAHDVLRFELIPDKMEQENIESGIRYTGVGQIVLLADLRVTVKEKPGLFAWLKKRKLGDIITPGINSSTLTAFIKQRIKDGKDIPSDECTITPITKASIRK